jgi:hypothetical protein
MFLLRQFVGAGSYSHLHVIVKVWFFRIIVKKSDNEASASCSPKLRLLVLAAMAIEQDGQRFIETLKARRMRHILL